jgi:hypothetical protein
MRQIDAEGVSIGSPGALIENAVSILEPLRFPHSDQLRTSATADNLDQVVSGPVPKFA